MPETKECRICHRIGYRAFVPEGDYGWVCARDDLCRTHALMHMINPFWFPPRSLPRDPEVDRWHFDYRPATLDSEPKPRTEGDLDA